MYAQPIVSCLSGHLSVFSSVSKLRCSWTFSGVAYSLFFWEMEFFIISASVCSLESVHLLQHLELSVAPWSSILSPVSVWRQATTLPLQAGTGLSQLTHLLENQYHWSSGTAYFLAQEYFSNEWFELRPVSTFRTHLWPQPLDGFSLHVNQTFRNPSPSLLPHTLYPYPAPHNNLTSSKMCVCGIPSQADQLGSGMQGGCPCSLSLHVIQATNPGTPCHHPAGGLCCCGLTRWAGGRRNAHNPSQLAQASSQLCFFLPSSSWHTHCSWVPSTRAAPVPAHDWPRWTSESGWVQGWGKRQEGWL